MGMLRRLVEGCVVEIGVDVCWLDSNEASAAAQRVRTQWGLNAQGDCVIKLSGTRCHVDAGIDAWKSLASLPDGPCVLLFEDGDFGVCGIRFGSVGELLVLVGECVGFPFSAMSLSGDWGVGLNHHDVFVCVVPIDDPEEAT